MRTKTIAQRQQISAKYLEQLMAMLKSGGFVRSVRGSKGGYVLSRSPDQIRLKEVFVALEGPVITVECLNDQSYCSLSTECVARGLWADLQQAVDKVLESVTLQDLIDRSKDKSVSDYQI
jgi:Rrf2 family protein